MEIVSDIASSILYLLCVYFVFNNRKVLENLHSGIDAIVRYKKRHKSDTIYYLHITYNFHTM